MNKPIREPCQECAKYKECVLERRGICTDFEERGQPEQNKIKRGDKYVKD